MLENIYNQRVTRLNKLKRTDSKTGVDVWRKSTVDDVVWYTKSARSAGSSSVFISTYITVLFPFNARYLPYMEWKKPGNQEEHFTMSSGDYIILGDVPENITANNIIKVLEQYGENVCQVKHHNANYKRFGARVQLKVEGV